MTDSDKAQRFNSGKIRYELIPTHLLEDTARVFEFGAKKYSAWNWTKRGMQMSTIIGCLKRHLAAIERGEDLDPESGLPHIGHLGCNFLMLQHVMNLVRDFPEECGSQDDRPTQHFLPKPSGTLGMFGEPKQEHAAINTTDNRTTIVGVIDLNVERDLIARSQKGETS